MFRRLVKLLLPAALFRTIEPYGHLLEAALMNLRYGFPARSLKVIGVTGTDGKTTTTMMIWKMLAEAGYKAGYMTTIGYGTPEHERANYIHMTTVSSGMLMRRIKEMKSEGIEWLVLETTSHALAQNRIWGIPFSLAVLTNVTHEHLDYHGTFEHYRDSKLKLFRLTARNKRGLQTGIINADDDSGVLFRAAVPSWISYGVEAGGLRAADVKTSPSGSRFKASYSLARDLLSKEPSPSRNLAIKVNLPGRFNIYNTLAAVGVGIALGLKDEQIEQGIAALKSVEGRMNTIDEGQEFTVIVDFAHTPDSFDKILRELRQATTKRLIAVFGSAGRRDEAKRPLQGASAGKWCDLVVVTEEDDRDVEGMEIMNQIASGAEQEGKVREKDLFLIHDRSEAIQFAIDQAQPGDTVMLLGKGHEKTIERADGEHPWDEIATARAAIRKRLQHAKV